MSEFEFVGLKVMYDKDRNIVSNFTWKCKRCGHIINTNDDKYPSIGCPECEAIRDYNAGVEMMEHNILYEPTYNVEDGSM